MTEENKPKKGGIGLKVVVGFTMAIVIMFLVGMGGWWFGVLVIIVLSLGLWEFYGMAEAKGVQPRKLLGIIALIAFFAFLIKGDMLAAGFTATAFILAAIALEMIGGPEDSTRNMSYTVFGFIYLGLAAHGVLLRNLEPNEMGIFFFLTSVAGSVFCDTGAMFTGRSFGKRKLAPSISPAKTVEGFIGGIIVGVLGVVAFTFACNVIFLDTSYLTYKQAALLGLLLSVTGMVGDLVESMIKRDAGVKDSGSLFPGHGGLLDRLDSPLFTFAATYYFVKFAL